MITLSNNSYEVLATGLLAAFFAQVIKFCIFIIKSRKINFKIFTTTGGMPSAHSAGVMGVATSVGLIAGWESLYFAISFALALVTMYDAAGIRRAAGKTAACLNRMMEDFYNNDVQAIGGKLKELLGHTPFEVVVGATFGVLFAIFFHKYLILHNIVIGLL